MPPAWRRLFLPVALVGLLLPVLGAASSRMAGPPRSPSFAARDFLEDRIWDDGKAEITVYRGTIERYGKLRELSARIIVVKEDMDLAQRVKSEAGPVAGRTRTVIKQNHIRQFTTGTYDYHQMCSTFLDRQTGALEKLAMTSSEACGITFVEMLPKPPAVDPNRDSHPKYRTWARVSHSYWEGEGDRDERISSLLESEALLAMDALPLWLRRLDLRKPHEFGLSLLPSQVGSRVGLLAFVPCRVEVAGLPDRYGLPVRVMGIRSDYSGKVNDRYWFDPAWPHALVRFEGGTDPTVLERVKTTRIAYWKETDPGDERLLLP